MHCRTSLVALLTAALALSVSCKAKRKKSDDDTTPASVAKTTDTGKAVEPAPEPIDPENPDWIPKEHVDGMKRFKDPGVYVDGKPMGILKFGELPVKLKPTWYEEEAAVEFKGGEKPRTEIVKQRRYRFTDYFEAVGVDISKVKEVHLWGGTRRHVGVIISGDNFRKYKDFMFRFGSDVFGKPIPHCPTGLADGGCPDNMIALTAYVDKEPPEHRGGYFYVDGKKTDGIPYFGDPVRGGVRVYKDGPMAAWIKRHKLDAVAEQPGINTVESDGTVRWSFFEVLKSQGVDTDSITEAWLIHTDRHVKQFGRAELEKATFVASSKRGGEILFGTEGIRTNAIALHSVKVPAKDLPAPLPHERHE